MTLWSALFQFDLNCIRERWNQWSGVWAQRTHVCIMFCISPEYLLIIQIPSNESVWLKCCACCLFCLKLLNLNLTTEITDKTIQIFYIAQLCLTKKTVELATLHQQWSGIHVRICDKETNEPESRDHSVALGNLRHVEMLRMVSCSTMAFSDTGSPLLHKIFFRLLVWVTHMRGKGSTNLKIGNCTKKKY